MPWKNRDTMSIRREFVFRAINGPTTFSQLCREFGISRKTGYKWMERYHSDGSHGLRDRSRRPLQMPSRTRDCFVEAILELRDKHPAWGAKKLRQVLLNSGHEALPSVATFNRILKEHCRVTAESSGQRQRFIRFERGEPNELWQMDFKGHFSLIEGECHPLTILDDCSRYSLCLRACPTENELVVREGLEATFREYGLPDAMTMDNGSPWKGYPGQRLSGITVWLMRLGIRVSHSRPGHPQTQGKDERFHRTLKEELLRYHNFQCLQDAQEHFDNWRDIYNNTRPHEALNMACPSHKYRPSRKPYTESLSPVEYPEGDEVKRVGGNGEIWFMGKRFYIGGHLRGEFIGVRQRKENVWDFYYVNSRIGGHKADDV
jgi:transposase InsO family protein